MRYTHKHIVYHWIAVDTRWLNKASKAREKRANASQEYHEQSQSRACFLFAVVSFSHRTTSSNWSCGCLCAVLYFCFLSSRRRRRHRHRFSFRCCWSERIFSQIAFLKNIHHHHHLSSLCLSSLSRSTRPDYIFTVLLLLLLSKTFICIYSHYAPSAHCTWFAALRKKNY